MANARKILGCGTCEALNGHSIAFAYHSGRKIENERITYNATREFLNGRCYIYTGDLRTLFEIRNAKQQTNCI